MAKVKVVQEDELQDNVIPDETPVEKNEVKELGDDAGDNDGEEKVLASRMAIVVKTNTGEKSVKVQVVEAVDCIIAGIPYKLSKDKSYSVPSDVAAILVNAKKAYRI